MVTQLSCHEKWATLNGPDREPTMPDDQHAPEVVIAPPEPPPPAPEESETSPKGPWERTKSWGKIAVAIFAGVPSAVIAAWILVSLAVLTFHRHSLDLDAIGVPETLSKAGFTSEVATQHLRDAIYAVQRRAATGMAKIGVDTDQDLSGVTIPKTGMSLQNVGVAVRSLLPGWRHEVSGEFVQLEKGLLLRLRLNGNLIVSKTAEKADTDAADALLGRADLGVDETLVKDDLESGAFNVVRATQPYLAASALYGNNKADHAAADREADRIIASSAPDEAVLSAVYLKGLSDEAFSYWAETDAFGASALYIFGVNGILTAADETEDRKSVFLTADENVLRAVTLKGLIAATRHDDAQAEAFFKKLPNFATARYNLGFLYAGQHKLERAIAEYRAAIWLDPKAAFPHSGLGTVYYDQHKLADAIAEFKTAIELDPKDADPHGGLGTVYYDQHKLDDAIAEYKTAMALVPKKAGPHNNLGTVYYDQHKLDDAIAEYKTAIELDPKDAGLHNNLGNVYYTQHKLADAIAEYKTAMALDPKLAQPHGNLGVVYVDQQRLDDACQAYAEASKLAPDDPVFPARMHDVDSLMNGRGHCPPF